jgi:hypothetical protein
MKRKCMFCSHFNAQKVCELKQQKVSPNGTCREHKYHSSLRGCCKMKL